jgi:uroporphyrinogen decarboxylase
MKSGGELSSRERVKLALARRETDRVPIAMICSGLNPPVYRELDAYLRRERGTDVESYLGQFVDVREVGPKYIGPPLARGEDMWGVKRRPVSYGAGSYDEIDYYPLASAKTPADLNRHRWPTTDWFDYSVMRERIAAAQAGGERALIVTNGNIFESSWYMRGFELMLEDLLLEPELARAILDRVTEFYAGHFGKMLAAARGAVDLAFTADDIGGQNGLLMSLRTWEELIKPCHVRLNRVIHEFGVKVVYHSDGDVMEAVDGLISMGIDVLQALQFSAGKMDPAILKRKYHDRLGFEGGVSVQTTLPFGTAQDVRAEVENLITVLGERGGYILGPSHLIQTGTPPENIVTMFDTAASFYPFGRRGIS